jgi:hypothetical protein
MSDLVKEDFLNVDMPIPGQQYACLSFISPENVMASKQDFFMEEFWKALQQQKLWEKENVNISEEYKTFIANSENDLENAFVEKFGNATSIRGLKVRGVYDNYKEAEIRSKQLQKTDPNHNVFIGQVGYWLPWDPSADKIVDQQYQEDQLNELMRGYNDNVEKRNLFYRQQKEERIQQIKEETEARKKANAEEGSSTQESLFESENVPTSSSYSSSL